MQMFSNPRPVRSHENDNNNTLVEEKITSFMEPLKIDHAKL